MPGAAIVSVRPAGAGVMRGCEPVATTRGGGGGDTSDGDGDGDGDGVPLPVVRGCMPVGGGSGGGGGFGLPEESSFPTSSLVPPLG
jgi:hypothetical protein